MDYSLRIANIEAATKRTLSHSERVRVQRLFAACAKSRRGDKVILREGLLLISSSGGNRYTVHQFVEAYEDPFDAATAYAEWYGHWEGFGNESLKEKPTQRDIDLNEMLNPTDFPEYFRSWGDDF